ncbi:response regulator [Reinekea thalattae]|uniref:Response regulator n=1 Tax=Reinekea thalattae TaxID=2593301 RepID=A0A5C8Z986_9GAMM|nr:response regulator [Reinekea thalattae]TXR53803.1 response regulator [Reinekea thalattae]
MDLKELQSLKVLIVDDFAEVRRSTKSMLYSLGFKTAMDAYDANSATKMLQENSFDLILCDYNLGDSRNGLRLLEEWRHDKLITPKTIFVLITGDTSKPIVVSAMEHQPDDYLSKPFTADILNVRISRWFERRRIMHKISVLRDRKDWVRLGKASVQVIKRYPRYRAQAQKFYAESLIQRKRYGDAESFLQGLLDRRYQSWAHMELCKILIAKGELETAEDNLRDLILNDLNQIEAYDYLAYVLGKRGNKKEQQQVLVQAIRLSPQNFSRLNRLTSVALENGDYHRASLSLKDLVTMSTNTMHESVELYQRYVHNLSIEQEIPNSRSRAREIGKEIIRITKRMRSKYGQEVNARVFLDAISVKTSSDPSSHTFGDKLDRLLAMTLDNVDHINSISALTLVGTFYAAGRYNDGDELVRRFSQRFKRKPAIIKELKLLQAEPVSLAIRQQAHELNVRGIKLYEKDSYGEAIQLFKQAMELSPRHSGIILNLVQSQVRMMKAAKPNPVIVKECRGYLERLDYLPREHGQYTRYKKLKEQFSKL